MLIQLYNGVKDNVGQEIDIAVILEKIRTPELEKPTSTLHRSIEELAYLKSQANSPEAGKEEWQKLVTRQEALISKQKCNLPAVTWSGTFTKRSINGIREYSQLICLDIDKLSRADFSRLRSQVTTDPHTFICFTSPSGNGIKVVFKVVGAADQIKGFFLSIEKYFIEKYSIKLDPSGKDVSRLCFLCHDVNLYVNERSVVYTDFIAEEKKSEKPFTKKELTELEAYTTTHEIFLFTEKRILYTPGNRNRFLNLFCNNCNRKGISMSDCANYCFTHMPDRDKAEITQTVENAYNNNKHEHGKFAKKTKPVLADNSAGNKNSGAELSNRSKANGGLVADGRTPGAGSHDAESPALPSSNGTTQKPVKFWKERTITRGKDENKYSVTVYELLRVEFTDFLFQQGFHLIDTDAKGYQICYSGHGIIEPVDARIIKKFVFAWCKKNVVREIEEMLRKGQKQFFASTEMDSLHTKNVQFKTDTEAESYFYFKNCWVTVTANNITTHDYTELQQYIWAGNKKEHDFSIQPPQLFTNDSEALLSTAAMDCEFAKFVYYCAYNPNNLDEKDFDQETIIQRFQSFCSAIGFLLDGYKHPSNRKSIFALDHKIGERGEQHGRTGKSIIPKACQHLKVVSHINGKSYDPKYQFRNEPITADAQIIDFNDMSRNFDVENIFEIIADDYSINRRNNGFLHFKYENSPKVYYSTNAIPKGEGGSYTGRMHIIEFSDYFTPTHTPYDEFGHGMLSGAWDNEEWNRFYNFMLFCVQQYKADGLVTYPKSNFDARKMANEVSIEFIDFMDGKIEKDKKASPGTAVLLNRRVKKIDLLEEFNKDYQNLYGSKLKPHTFIKWIRQYCQYKGLFFNTHVPPGKYDKSNGIEYYTISTVPDFKPVESEQKLF